VLNNNPDVKDRLKVVFLPDYNVTLGQKVDPAADLSEQISLAGKEASGTGCMEFATNGALTIGTLDGANIEIREEVGPENFFLFGLTAVAVAARNRRDIRSPAGYYWANPVLKEIIDAFSDGVFSRGGSGLFQPLIHYLLDRDEDMLFADFQSYVECQALVSEAYFDVDRWSRMSILNTARSGKFPSDRSVRDYARLVWHVDKTQVTSLEAVG